MQKTKPCPKRFKPVESQPTSELPMETDEPDEPPQACESEMNEDIPTSSDVAEEFHDAAEVIAVNEPNANVLEATDDDSLATVKKVDVEEKKECASVQSDEYPTVTEPPKIKLVALSKLKMSVENVESPKPEDTEIIPDIVQMDTDAQTFYDTKALPNVLDDINSREVENATLNAKTNNVIDLVDLDDNDSNEQTDTTDQPNQASDDEVMFCKVVSPEVTKDTGCINHNCQGGDDLVNATESILNYYGIKRRLKQPQKVCRDCREECIIYTQRLATKLAQGEPVLKYQKVIHQKIVEIDDSDEEDKLVETKSELNKQAEVFEEQLNDAGLNMDALFEHYQVKRIVQNNVNYLDKGITSIRDKALQCADECRELQQKFDRLRAKIYEDDANKPRKDLPELHIMDVEERVPTPEPPTVPDPPRTTNPPEPTLTIRALPLATVVIEDEESSQNQTAGTFDRNNMTDDYPPLKVHDFLYGLKASGSWHMCELMEILADGTYRVEFLSDGKRMDDDKPVRILNGKQVAFAKACGKRFSVGERVIALFSNSLTYIKEGFYAGIVAEPPENPGNRGRYLIFSDDGYAQYVPPRDIRLVVERSANVWEDIPQINSQEYVCNYLDKYPSRPMVVLRVGQVIKTEYNGSWYDAQVKQVDNSLALMLFISDNHTEWIYRGSKRLSPLFKQSSTQQAIRQSVTPARRHWRKSGAPYIEYTNFANQDQMTRAVAKKSTSAYVPQINYRQVAPRMTSSELFDGKVTYYTFSKKENPPTYRQHTCSRTCNAFQRRKYEDLVTYGLYTKPMLMGWARLHATYKKSTTLIYYQAPCGRMLADIDSTYAYLTLTGNELDIDHFEFDPDMHPLARYKLQEEVKPTPDITDGIEALPVQCANAFDSSLPSEMRYLRNREPTEGVKLNLDVEFLSCCDCTDNCFDKTACACWQLTLQGELYTNPKKKPWSIGYEYKRLLNPVLTGIYECNDGCKCQVEKCLNRVVQHPIKHFLQVFKTFNRGWGLRCENDIPRGAFICIYAGQLLTEQKANEGGIQDGDEYLAELDYIEVAERHKEGYESMVLADRAHVKGNDESSEEETATVPNGRKKDRSDRDYAPSLRERVSELNEVRRSSRRSKVKEDDESGSTEEKAVESEGKSNQKSKDDDCINISSDEEIRQPSSFTPKANLENTESDDDINENSTRYLFGPNETCYIMDAKNAGNIGRYLNHSCSPNVFVQNVFVDTHDLRFPWVAFFAATHIKAGTELTWNYNYEIGSVPGKVLYCQCGSSECRGRLL